MVYFLLLRIFYTKLNLLEGYSLEDFEISLREVDRCPLASISRLSMFGHSSGNSVRLDHSESSVFYGKDIAMARLACARICACQQDNFNI